SVWEIGPELKSGALKVVLPQCRGSSKVAIYAVYPSRQFLPAKLKLFIDFLAQQYGPRPIGTRASISVRATRPRG
ncbi:MAG: hypothetical protein HC850_16375, partial [Rhodomicrobium sp.]|nr:hypothetical protein [Rhodomicrobium sp.]